jgi:GT2 family glycosyltransferase
MNTIDVVVPCYNYARFLPRCVHSILSQEGVAVRVLVIDDCSKDDSAQVAARLAAADSRVQFARHEKNAGHIATYNEGLIDWAKSEYSLLLSADDMLTPGALARATTALEKHPEAAMAYGMALSFVGEEDPPPIPAYDDADQIQVIGSRNFIEHTCLNGNDIPTPTAVVRTSVQQKIGGYKPHLKHSGDMEMWLRFASQGAVVVLRATQAYYRHHSSNMSSQYLAAHLVDQLERLQACVEFCENWARDLPDHETLITTIHRDIAMQALWVASHALDLGNATLSRQALALSQGLSVDVKNTGMWRKLQIKRLFGAVVWSRLRRLADSDPSHMSAAQAKNPASARRSGWWPANPSSEASTRMSLATASDAP